MWKALSSVLVCLVLASSVSAAETSPAQTLQLPDPTGPYKIGTALFDWVDTSREEAWVAGSAHPRELVVQIWYPADSTEGLKTAPYVFDLARIKASLEQDWPAFPTLQTHALVGAKLSAAQRKYPVLVFSHGLNATPWPVATNGALRSTSAGNNLSDISRRDAFTVMLSWSLG
jgi:predicted dienelactone hydrolase